MIQSGFLSEEDRKALTALARDGSSPCRVSRRANALVLLDKGWSCQQVADALLLDDDTIRGWRKLFEQRGIEGITSFDVGGSASYLGVKQEDDLKAWVSTNRKTAARRSLRNPIRCFDQAAIDSDCAQRQLASAAHSNEKPGVMSRGFVFASHHFTS